MLTFTSLLVSPFISPTLFYIHSQPPSFVLPPSVFPDSAYHSSPSSSFPHPQQLPFCVPPFLFVVFRTELHTFVAVSPFLLLPSFVFFPSPCSFLLPSRFYFVFLTSYLSFHRLSNGNSHQRKGIFFKAVLTDLPSYFPFSFLSLFSPIPFFLPSKVYFVFLPFSSWLFKLGFTPTQKYFLPGSFPVPPLPFSIHSFLPSPFPSPQ